jgi:hypothetical protein
MSDAPGTIPSVYGGPVVADIRDSYRMEHTRRRRRIIYGEHIGDIQERINKQIGFVRADVMGLPDMSANTLLAIASQVSVLYNDEPEIGAPAGSEGLVRSLADLGVWPLMQRVQRDCWAFREMLVRVDVDDETQTLAVRPVYPDLVQAVGDPRRPDRPTMIREYINEPGIGWCAHVRDIRNPKNPSYRVYAPDGVKDITKDLNDGLTFEGLEGYDCIGKNSRPFLPYAWYHAAASGWLFDPFTFQEVVEVAINAGVYLTYYRHVLQNAAWAQRWTLGANVRGTNAEGEPGREHQNVVADPASVVMFDAAPDSPNPQVGQWAPPIDPAKILESVGVYERRALLLAGLSPSDVTRQDADIRSGYSLAVSNEAVRAVQKNSAPQFRRGDQDLLSICARLSNRYLGTDYAEAPGDYRVSYCGLQPSPIEAQMQLDVLKAKQAAGFVGPVSAYMEFNPTSTREEAVHQCALSQMEGTEVAEEVAKLGGGGGSTPPGVVVDPKTVIPMMDLLKEASAGAVDRETVYETAVSLCGLTEASARRLADSIKVAIPPPSAPPQTTTPAPVPA